MADSLLQGHFPMRGLYQALAVAAMCLQEQAATRPLIGDVVTALTYLASQTYDPSAASSQTNRLSTPSSRTKEEHRSLGGGFDSPRATYSPRRNSPDLRQRDNLLWVNIASDGATGDAAGSSSGRKAGLQEGDVRESHRDSPVHLGKTKDALKGLNRDIDRERAVAEAKVWGENWRERRRSNAAAGSCDGTNE